MENLSGDYIAGFVDGEGCFALNYRRDIRHDRGKRSGIKPVYFYWDIQFAIVLREDDKEILDKIKKALGCGKVTGPNKNGSVRFQSTDINDLSEKIVPFFEKHKLHAKKKFDFQLWKEAVKLFKRNQRLGLNIKIGGGFSKTNWDPKDLKRLTEIREEMIGYKSKRKQWKWA
ncbi:MAG: hypothetical protein D4Q79_02270 [Spirochaetia bacterium]|nr:MAG: hypothetical protein D4Q79_02270 [Spirochaetia bacterium]